MLLLIERKIAKMVAVWKVAVPFTIFVTFIYCIQTSEYIKTKVFVGSPNCTGPYTSNVLYLKVTRSKLSCATLCTSVENCRRVVYNKITMLCKLYDSAENCLTPDNDSSESVCFRQKSTCNETTCSRCALGFYGDHCQFIITDCSDGKNKAVLPASYSHAFIQTSPRSPIIEVKCSPLVTLLLYRSLSCSEVNFNRSWQEYSVGFGHTQGNYWIGLENIYNIRRRLISARLHITINTISSGRRMIANYGGFDIADSSQDYRITIGPYLNHATHGTDDAFTLHASNINGRPFSTYDRDFSSNNCPVRFNSGWWYLDDSLCSLVNLNGKRSTVTSEESWFWIHEGKRIKDIKFISMRISAE